MSNDKLMSINLHTDFTVSVDNYDNGIVNHKKVSSEEVAKAFYQSSGRHSVISSGFLPKNCVSYTCEINNVNKYIVIEHSERFADIKYHETSYEHFPIPRYVFGFKLSENNRITGINMGVVEHNTPLDEKTLLYKFPFSNVSGFALCTGSNRLPIVKKLAALNNLIYYILSLPENDDHYNSKYNKLNLGHRELMEHLKDKSPDYYYTNILILSGKKLQDFI